MYSTRTTLIPYADKPLFGLSARYVLCIATGKMPKEKSKVLTTMTQILAPVVPHLAEEINSVRYAGDHSGDDERSVFEHTWVDLVCSTLCLFREMCIENSLARGMGR